METGAKTPPGLLMVAGCLAGGLLGGVVSRSRGSVAFGLALGALGGAVGDYMVNLQRNEWSHRKLVEFLGEHLGEDVTAYLSGIEDPETVRAWAQGQVQPSPDEMSRLVIAYEATQCLSDVCGDTMIRSWFFGMNPMLEDRAPAYVLRHLKGEDLEIVLSAAQEFAEN